MNKPFPPDMAGLRDTLNQVRYVGEQFTKPDDDWMPVAFLYSRKKIKIVGIEMTRGQKDGVVPALTAIAHGFKAVRGALVMSVWHHSVVMDSPLKEVEIGLMDQMGVRNHPDRKEAVQVELYDGKDTEVWMADIIRHVDKPPTLGQWIKIEGENRSGRFANVLERCIGKQ